MSRAPGYASLGDASLYGTMFREARRTAAFRPLVAAERAELRRRSYRYPIADVGVSSKS
ncbi:MAG: hypothetical protein J1F07_04320 [Muribaculaceae bacterium]|nr:hypothetical protein [Muribaculaceae bacterium]